jgi:hypothetical protein
MEFPNLQKKFKESCFELDRFKQLVEEKLEITNNDDDRLTKKDLIEIYRIMFDKVLTPETILSEAKRCGLTYDRYKRYNNQRGVFTGVKSKCEEFTTYNTYNNQETVLTTEKAKYRFIQVEQYSISDTPEFIMEEVEIIEPIQYCSVIPTIQPEVELHKVVITQPVIINENPISEDEPSESPFQYVFSNGYEHIDLPLQKEEFNMLDCGYVKLDGLDITQNYEIPKDPTNNVVVVEAEPTTSNATETKRTRGKKKTIDPIEQLKLKVKEMLPDFNPLGCKEEDDYKRVYKAVCDLIDKNINLKPKPPKKTVTIKDIKDKYGVFDFENIDVSKVEIP